MATLGLIVGSFGFMGKMGMAAWRNVVLVSSILSLFFMMAFWHDWFIAGAAINAAAIALVLKDRPLTRSIPVKVAL
ncbi:MAG: hypothetical protein MIO87_04145 [Methanomassiliicoccales archaeon]|nr:hypothetical protein [Methanomassiliicoccales archaeon]